MPPLPSLPGSSKQLRLYDTAAGSLVPVGPPTPGQVRMYVCGITPYDAAHLGHAATYLAFDVAQRVWRDAGHTVRYVQNVTDIDDPLLERANRDNVDWAALASQETQVFRDDMAALRIIPPEKYLGVIESMESIAEMVAKLLASGAAYQLDDGTADVYFDIKSASDFGYESRLDRAMMLNLFAERGGDAERAGKRDALDPLLWRGAREGEPSWPSSMGPGRPGWHVECSVIAVNELGMDIDVQGGGSDLLFPHHEMSAAHAEVAYGTHPFAKAYVHTGMIAWQGEKMSKSKGNLVFTSDLRRAGIDPAVIRLALLAGHYRANREWTEDLLAQAQTRLDQWRAAVLAVAGPDAAPVLAQVRENLADDLDTPGAIAAIDEWAFAVIADPEPETGSLQAPALIADTAEALLGISLR